MKLGKIEFVAWTYLSDAFENLCTLLQHSYDYDGKNHGTLDVQYGNGEEYDLTIEEYETLETKYPNWTENERINCYYETICEQEQLVLVTYDQLKQIETVQKAKTRKEVLT